MMFDTCYHVNSELGFKTPSCSPTKLFSMVQNCFPGKKSDDSFDDPNAGDTVKYNKDTENVFTKDDDDGENAEKYSEIEVRRYT